MVFFEARSALTPLMAQMNADTILMMYWTLICGKNYLCRKVLEKVNVSNIFNISHSLLLSRSSVVESPTCERTLVSSKLPQKVPLISPFPQKVSRSSVNFRDSVVQKLPEEISGTFLRPSTSSLAGSKSNIPQLIRTISPTENNNVALTE